MNDRVVVAAERGFVRAGLSTLRFNFRGVGASEGSFDEGKGEQEDVRAALAVLAARVPDLPLVVGGYSFGCAVGLPVAACDERVVALLGIGVPFTLVGPPDLSPCPRPKVFVQGELDELGPVDKVREWAASLPGETEVVTVPGADHFFAGDLATAVMDTAERVARLALGPEGARGGRS
jgi:alpha/beta superfamily hydrolase